MRTEEHRGETDTAQWEGPVKAVTGPPSDNNKQHEQHNKDLENPMGITHGF